MTVMLSGGVFTREAMIRCRAVSGARDDGVDNRPESSRSKFYREDSTARIQGLALGVMALLQHGEGLGG